MKHDTIKTYTIKPGDIIVAKVNGIERTCEVIDIGAIVIIVLPLRTKRADPFEPLYYLQASDITEIIPAK